ncbi:hypothetical protein C8R45DRAFT_934387 [Mycena sanguinolenta]|nr:hypothetical protein C8R45DRAFT_934387 [Mycena sanguinolenta]
MTTKGWPLQTGQVIFQRNSHSFLGKNHDSLVFHLRRWNLREGGQEVRRKGGGRGREGASKGLQVGTKEGRMGERNGITRLCSHWQHSAVLCLQDSVSRQNENDHKKSKTVMCLVIQCKGKKERKCDQQQHSARCSCPASSPRKTATAPAAVTPQGARRCTNAQQTPATPNADRWRVLVLHLPRIKQQYNPKKEREKAHMPCPVLVDS